MRLTIDGPAGDLEAWLAIPDALPLDRAGLLVGDVLVAVDGVTLSSTGSLARVVRETSLAQIISMSCSKMNLRNFTERKQACFSLPVIIQTGQRSEPLARKYQAV